MKTFLIIRWPVWLFILSTLLPACKSVVEAPPPPTLIPLRMAYTPALYPLISRLAACAEKQPEAALFLDQIPASQFNTDQYDAVLQMGKASDAEGYTVLLGYDELKIIVNIKNPILSIDPTAMQDLFEGNRRTWDALSPPNAVYVVSVQPWLYLTESELSDLAVSDLLLTKASSTARLASDPGQVIQGVSDESGAVGFVPGSWLVNKPEGVKTIELAGEFLSEKIPVLAVTRSEPQGALRSLLACVSNPGN